MKVESVSARKKKFLESLSENKISQQVIDAFKAVEQEMFFDKVFADKLYTNETILTGYGEKSDPIELVAKMINYLSVTKNMRVLEVGTGSGYSTAVLSLLCREVYTIDIDERLAAMAKLRLYNNGYENIRFFSGDGTSTDIEFGKVDAVIVWAACYKRPLVLMKHMVKGGTLIFPMGPPHMQQIVFAKNEPDIEKGISFKMFFRDQGLFSQIKGDYAFKDTIDLGAEIYADVNEIEELPDGKTVRHDLDNHTI
jgi:protein-L-isoaspartate(D-aspartate) O-methyltransferase